VVNTGNGRGLADRNDAADSRAGGEVEGNLPGAWARPAGVVGGARNSGGATSGRGPGALGEGAPGEPGLAGPV